MKIKNIVPMGLLACAALTLLGPLASAASNADRSTTAESAEASLKKILVFDPKAMDTGANPCDDFYQYACGTWLKNNPIPSDQASWSRFHELFENNRQILRDILQDAGKGGGSREPDTQKIGDYYAACMDEDAINRKGLAPLQPELVRINQIKNKADLTAEVAHLHAIGAPVLFSFGPLQDYQNSSQMIAGVDQGGFALPDRDYYLKPDFAGELKDYTQHIGKMLQLAGDSKAQADANAAVILRVETGLAEISMDRVQRRDPNKVHNKMLLKNLAGWTPSLDWKKYVSEVNAPAFQDLDVQDTGFFKGLEGAIASIAIEDWKTYLRWQVLHEAAPFLSTAFVNENFDFFNKKLNGQKEIKPRWKRCVAITDGGIGEALGKAYVDRAFGKEGKEQTLKMIHEIEKDMGKDIEAIAWMSPETKKQAFVKLDAVLNKIGYPDRWRDYSKLEIIPGDALGNQERANLFEFNRQLAKIGKPVDKNEWDMTPPTVNAYYDPQMNSINFPAGILQPPFYDAKTDTAANLGSIGAVIGHELTHGFDDEGRHYDEKGNLRDWWIEQDGKNFEKLAQGIADEYSQFVALKDPKDPSKDIHVNGKLTLGENIADNGGARLAFAVLMDSLAAQKPGPTDGFTPEQRFFISYGQSWCENRTEALSKERATTDPHSPPKYRVIGVISNAPEFKKAFSCREDSPMVRSTPGRVW